MKKTSFIFLLAGIFITAFSGSKPKSFYRASDVYYFANGSCNLLFTNNWRWFNWGFTQATITDNNGNVLPLWNNSGCSGAVYFKP